MFDPNTATLTGTPIAAYNVGQDASRPMAAALLGVSRHTLNRQIKLGSIAAAGRTELRVPFRDIEAVRGRPISVHDWLSALGKARTSTPSTRRAGHTVSTEARPDEPRFP